MNIKRASREISYRALKLGHGSVQCLPERIDTDNEVDFVSIEGGKKVYIDVKATEGTDIFNITSTELGYMKDSSKKGDSYSYIIHRYRFDGDELTSFNMYEYDKEHNVLVDIRDNTKICSIAPIKGTAQFACTPLKITKKYELK